MSLDATVIWAIRVLRVRNWCPALMIALDTGTVSMAPANVILDIQGLLVMRIAAPMLLNVMALLDCANVPPATVIMTATIRASATAVVVYAGEATLGRTVASNFAPTIVQAMVCATSKLASAPVSMVGVEPCVIKLLALTTALEMEHALKWMVKGCACAVLVSQGQTVPL